MSGEVSKKEQEKIDRRRETSKLNALKAGRAKVAQLRAKKNTKQYKIYSESESDSESQSDYSDSESEEEFVMKPLKKKKAPAKSKSKHSRSSRSDSRVNERIDQLASIVQQLAKNKTKSKRRSHKKSSTVVQIVQPDQAGKTAKQENPALKEVTRKLFDF